MKLKKLFISLPVVTMGAGLLATVLTSCGGNDVDADKKVTLDDEGKLNKEVKNGDEIVLHSYDFREAARMALTRSTSWATFKEALAEEIVLKWYEDRMYEDKDGKKDRNKTFKSNYDEWKYQINKDYDTLVQSQKTKYGSNYKFYLQNEYLSQYGGTEETYKHAKLVEKVKSEFINNVFKFNYFGYSAADQGGREEILKAYPQIFTKDASTNVSRENLNNPANWSNVGFYASVNPSFSMKTWPAKIADITDEVINFLAKNPDGDYATIQNFVFNRYYDEIKPFLSSASLFKYSKPHGIEEGDKLSVIYNTSDTAVKLPDEPNESFPFFGGAEPTDASKGTRMFMEWYNAFNEGDFATKFIKQDTTECASNGTVSISNTASGGKGKYSEDSQTLLLTSAIQMLGGTDPLYVPYATVAAQMYQQMMLGDSAIKNSKMNITTKKYLASTVPTGVFEAISNNNPAIFKNFFFDPTQYDLFLKEGDSGGIATGNTHLYSYLDLSRVYPTGIVSGTGSSTDPIEYHCPLFKNVKNFKYFYGNTEDTSGKTYVGPNGKYYTSTSGVVFVTNTMYIDSFTPDKSGITGQPWALQLNQSGMHAQTIDGYDFVARTSTSRKETFGVEEMNRSEAAKLVFKYRLMQKRTDQIDFMSGDLLGSSGKLKTYFTNNFADIILDMAQDTTTSNMFRKLDTFKKESVETATDYFFNKLVDEQKFDLANLQEYLKLVATYDATKKNIESIEKINSYIYEYRTKVITTAKSKDQIKTIYGNGLLAPLTYAFDTTISKTEGEGGITNHDYRVCNIVADIIFYSDPTEDPSVPTNRTFRKDLTTCADDIANCKFITEINDNIAVNADSPFSAQVKAAKNVMSNRFWYKSAIIDKVMYAFNSNKTGLTNAIKNDVYKAYEANVVANDETLKTKWEGILADTSFKNAKTTTYEKGKVITGNTTYAELGATSDKYADFLTNIANRYTLNNNYQIALNGAYADDIVNAQLFEATLAYLCADNYKNLYKTLNSKIGENEVALVGYINKLNPWFPETETAKGLEINKAVDKSTLEARYGFYPSVENLFDQDGFAGGDVATDHAHSKDASSTYWNLIANSNASATGALAGFTGIQSKSSNSFDSASGLQTAVFDKFAWSTQNTTNILDTTVKYGENCGAWFAFAGYLDNNQKPITFNDITFKPESGEAETFKASQLAGDDDHAECRQVLRLAKKIADYDSIDDLKTLAKTVADAYDGGTVFKQIGYGELVYQDVNEMRIRMLKALPYYTLKADGTPDELQNKDFVKCFERVTNVEVHTTNKLDEGNQDYCFEDGKGNGYNAYIKQINKADITEKRLHYTFDGSSWTAADKTNPLSAEEFLYILCATASEASVQSTVITQAIKTILGDDKLTVYDAGLYNTFDSSWIKDWVKKPLGK